MKRHVMVGGVVFVRRDEAGEHRGQVERHEDVKAEHRCAVALQLRPDDLGRRPPAPRLRNHRLIEGVAESGRGGQDRLDDGFARPALHDHRLRLVGALGGLFAAGFFEWVTVWHGNYSTRMRGSMTASSRSAIRLPTTSITTSMVTAAITSGSSLSRSASNTSVPRPGQVKTYSVSSAPASRYASDSPNSVTSGLMALPSAWRKMMRRSDKPLARAVRM